MATNLKFDVPDHLYPFEHRFADLGNGIEMHYVDEGEGETLLMLHGNPSWSFLYRKMILKLRGNFRCIVPDYPGFGLTETPPGYGFTPGEHSENIERFVDKLGLRDMTLIVQDWGGPVGLGLAIRRPELVKRFVIGNTWAWPLVGQRGFEVFSWLMVGPVGRTMAYLFNGVARFFFMKGFVHRPEKEVRGMYLAPFRRRADRRQTSISPRLLIKAADYLSEVEKGLERIGDRPVFLPWGVKDFAFQEKERQRFEKIFPNHKTLLLEASHFWQEDAGEEAADAIREWMRG
ncbi:MAG: alpha/beta fold hydrolase [SAR324 cluster bacterium]|nr:alpha/beta fold hydrolase [SAR324 cluster bacterium]